MTKIKQISFDEYLEKMKYQQEWRCIKRKSDVFVICCGNEGAGKSELMIATACHIDPSYGLNRIYFDWDRYKKILQGVLKTKMQKHSMEKLQKYNADVGLDLDAFMQTPGFELEPGCALHYDEAGRGASNREAMINIEQYKAMQTMRHLRTFNIWCAPKLRVLEVYAREERLKFFIWVEDEGTLEAPDRYAYIWSKYSIGRIYSIPYWWQLFYCGTGALLKQCPPDFYCQIPNLEENDKYIPKDLLEGYEIRKMLFDAVEFGKDKAKKEEKEDPGPAKPKPPRRPVLDTTLEEHQRRYGVSPPTARADFTNQKREIL